MTTYGGMTRRLAHSLLDVVGRSLTELGEWNITPAPTPEALRDLLRVFAEDYATLAIGLTDTSIIDTALGLKRKTYRNPQDKVHIWTKDRGLKAREPDSEENPYLG